MVWSRGHSFGSGKIAAILGKYPNNIMKTLGRYQNRNNHNPKKGIKTSIKIMKKQSKPMRLMLQK